MTIKSVININRLQQKSDITYLSHDVALEGRHFHKSFRDYQTTPLVHLNHLAHYLGIKQIAVKDESKRFNLNAFKVLGCSYAIGKVIAEQTGLNSLTYDQMMSADLGDVTFVTATDGNHGRGVAWTANQLKQQSVVYMPKGSAISRLNHIKHEGAKASITDMNYDEAVVYAAKMAEENNWILIQDTAWKGYEEIPKYIMQGYMTMALEAYESLQEPPTHIFIQAGVGSLAGAIQGFFANVYGDNGPKVIVVEPEKADCLYQTAAANDGNIHYVKSDLDTIMAGLACGEPNPMAWPIMRDYSFGFLSCHDSLAAKGMRILGNPLNDDIRIIAGESGAIGIGALATIMTDPNYMTLKNMLGLDEHSSVLCFNTEGDTDPVNYLDVVWHGNYPNVLTK